MTTPSRSLKILLIENDPSVALEIRSALTWAGSGAFELDWTSQLSGGLQRLSESAIDAVLLELSLPDSHGVKTFQQVFRAAPHVPILIVGGDVDEAVAKEAVGQGAQDYLLRSRLDSYSLSRALRSAVERKAIEDALFVEKERAEVTFSSISDAVLCTDSRGKITYINLVAATMTGWGREEAIGRSLGEVFQIIDGATRQPARDLLGLVAEQGTTVGPSVDCILVRRDGFESAIEDSAAPIHDRAGCITGGVIVFHDVSVARAMSRKMAHSAQHDVVTNLPNRLLLNDRITQAISLARRSNKALGVLFLDLDRFKYINDSLGHAAGDKVLQSVAKRLSCSVRSSDTVSRQGGDEFVILLSEISNPEDAATSAKKIILSLNEPHAVGGQDLHVEASIGISVYPFDGEDAETLIKNADTAMYHAKARGRNNFQLFKKDMNQKAVERQMVAESLHGAIERNEFVLHYQPKVNLTTGEFTGVEALIRWQHPERGLVHPLQFMLIAEDCGLVLPIGRLVLGEACRQARAWQEAGLSPLPMSVNVSAVEFCDEYFVEGVRTVLSESGLQAKYLELELTESVLMQDVESTAYVLRELKRMGLRLAVDDFGTGYSSLSYLRQFPIDVLKIDQSFVQQIGNESASVTIINAIISMGKSLKHRVIAEGVETPEQREYLQAQGCDEGQGYLFCQPLAAAEFARLSRKSVPSVVGVSDGVAARRVNRKERARVRASARG